MSPWRVTRVLGPFFLLVACSSSGGSRSDGANEGGTSSGGSSGTGGNGGVESGNTTHVLRGGCPLSQRVGRFTIEKQKDFGIVQGTVLDGIVPTAIPVLVLEKDGCQIWRRQNLACNPACNSTQTCGEKGKCIAYPRQVSVGKVSIDGLTKPVEMEPQSPGAVYFAPGQDNPPFDNAARVRLKASGSETIDAFELYGDGSAPLTEEPSWVLESGKTLEVSWPAGTTTTRIDLELTIDQHGITPLSLTCQFDDDGAAPIPQELIDRLLDSGVSGFPNGRMQRHTLDHIDDALGCIELSVGSTLSANVRVAGVTPCSKPEDCPSGLMCDTVKEICR